MDAFPEEVRNQTGIVDISQVHGNNDPIDTPKSLKWESMFTTPKHFGKGFDADTITIAPIEIKSAMQQLSREMTQAMKFYIDLTDDKDSLDEKEVQAILPTLDIYNPYPLTLLQVESADIVYMILVKDEGQFADTGEPMLTMFMTVYHKEKQFFQLDLNKYILCFHKHEVKDGRTGETDYGGYTFWIADSVFKEITDLSADYTEHQKRDAYSSESLNAWIHGMTSSWQLFMIYLNYPAICSQKDVKGRANGNWHDIPMRKYTTSEFRNKPKFEHKELVIQMYDTGTGDGNSTGRSSGTKFHSVRKHLRRYKDGKLVWIKAHFRGAKEHGVVNKDYKIAT